MHAEPAKIVNKIENKRTLLALRVSGVVCPLMDVDVESRISGEAWALFANLARGKSSVPLRS